MCAQPLTGGDHVCREDATVQASPTARPPMPPGPPEPLRGDLLAGRYEILEKAGEGGGGLVYRALDRRLGIVIALKLLPPGGPIEGLRKRLEREIRITRDVDHPNVSRVFDLGEDRGRTFLTMRWIDGIPLGARVRRQGPLVGRELARFAQTLIAALAAAHRLGIVHRDVKPANVMVSSSGDAVLVDFGVATSEGTSPVAQARLGERITLDGHTPGTPAWMSPEQLRGQPTPPATDLWALALTLGHAVTGEIGRPESPERSFAPFEPALRALLHRCLSDDPTHRPRDAVAIEEALARRARRKRALRIGALGGLVALLVAGGSGLAAWRAGTRASESGLPAVHVGTLENETGDPSLDWLEHGAQDLILSALESSGAVRIAPDRDAARAHVKGVVQRRPSGAAVELVLTSADGRLLARHDVPGPTGDALFAGVDSAVASFLIVLGAKAPASSGPAGVAQSLTRDVVAFEHFARAQDHLRNHRMPEALADLRSATDRDPGLALAQIERWVLAGLDHHGTDAEASAARDLAVRNQARLARSQQELLAAVLEAHPASGPARTDRLQAYLRSHPPDGALYWIATRVVSTDSLVRRAILEEWAARLPTDAEPHNQLGYLLLTSFEDTDGAERAFREYLRLAPDVPNAHDSYGDFLKDRGRTTEALASYDRALAIDPGFASAAVGAVDAAVRARDFPEAGRRLAAARPMFSASSREFAAWADCHVAVPLLQGDSRAAFARLDALASDPTIGARAHLVLRTRAILLALAGHSREADRAAQESARLRALYEGETDPHPSLPPYVALLAAARRSDVAGLARAEAGLAAADERLDPQLSARRLLAEGLLLAARGDPSRGAEKVLPSSAGFGGLAMLMGLERARMLLAAGRLDEGFAAQETAMISGARFGCTPEVASEWRAAVRETADLATRLGKTDSARTWEEEIAKL